MERDEGSAVSIESRFVVMRAPKERPCSLPRDVDYRCDWLQVQDELDGLAIERIEQQKLAQEHARDDPPISARDVTISA